MKGAAKPTIGLILTLALLFIGLKMLGWGVNEGKLEAKPEKITSKLKILQPKNRKSDQSEKPTSD